MKKNNQAEYLLTWRTYTTIDSYPVEHSKTFKDLNKLSKFTLTLEHSDDVIDICLYQLLARQVIRSTLFNESKK